MKRVGKINDDEDNSSSDDPKVMPAKRGKRFSQMETDLLLSLVMSSNINSMETNRMTSKERSMGWESITSMYILERLGSQLQYDIVLFILPDRRENFKNACYWLLSFIKCSLPERGRSCSIFVLHTMTDSWPLELHSKYLQEILKISLQIIRNYNWLIDAYVLDFYVDEHWSKLPNSWRNHLEPLDPDDLANIIRGNTKCTSVRPLSLLCLMSLMKRLCVSRIVKSDSHLELIPNKSLIEHPKLKNIFTKCVKPKKRHEIAKMAKCCHESVVETSVDFVVDFGAGLGHLARVLGYGYGVQVCCLEMQSTLNEQARTIDLQLETTASRYMSPEEKQTFRRPVHITMKLNKSVSAKEFVEKITDALGFAMDSQFCFGIIGLHPCGDLGAILTQMFLSCKEAKFLNFVGCCYMKLSTEEQSTNPGYPLSEFLRNPEITSHLSYESREIACHASEMYCDRLESGKYEDLKVHSFRATIEKILMKYWPELRHTGLRNVKHSKGMQFEDYVKLATNGLNIQISQEDVHSETTRSDLRQWKRIVIFYTMRLLFAPLVESVILFDRILYLKEKGCSANIAAIFDPRLSPRNHITSATKLGK